MHRIAQAASLGALAKASYLKQLPSVSGFFFGSSDGSEIADDLEFVSEAREALAAGPTVFYSSWW